MAANDGQYTDDRHFHKKRKKGWRKLRQSMTGRLAPGQLRLRPTSAFVFCDPVFLSNYFLRLLTTQIGKKA
jgi:hypothetical protein